MKTKFAIITDMHFGPAKYETPQHRAVENMLPEIVAGVVEKINAESDIEFVINLGDLVQEYTKNPSRDQDLDNSRKVLGILGKLKAPLYHVMGNHDRMTLSVADLKTVFGHELYYSFETHDFKNIVLQCESPKHTNVHLVDGETEWLMEELKSAKKPVFIFMHQMLVEHPLENTSCNGIPDCAYLRNKEEIMQIISKHGNVKAVFNGHMHSNLFAVQDGISFATIQAMTEPFPNSSMTAEAFAIVQVSGKTLSVDVRGKSPAHFKSSIQ